MKKSLRIAVLATAALLLLGGGLYFLWPSFLSRNYDQKNLVRLKAKAQHIRTEFAAALAAHDRLSKIVRPAPSFQEKKSLFGFFEKLRLRPETEGVSAYDSDDKLVLWLGTVVDLEDRIRPRRLAEFAAAKAPFIVRDKASVFLVSIETATQGAHLAVFKRLAFIPQFQTSGLKESHFLPSRQKKNCEIDYWNFQEDVSEFENIFAKTNDEFSGQMRQKHEIQTLYFPLRGPDKKILATITLSSPSLAEHSADLRENILLGLYVLLIIEMILLLIRLLKGNKLQRKKSFPVFILMSALLAGIRLLFIPLSRLEKVQSLSFFSPAGAGFFSVGPLTSSPADIFLSSLILLLLAASLFLFIHPILENLRNKISRSLSIILGIAALPSIFLIFLIFQETVRRLVFNSNIPLLRFTPGWSFIFLHLALLFFLTTVVSLAYLILKSVLAVFSSRPVLWLVFFVFFVAAGFVLSDGRYSPPAVAIQLGVLFALFILANPRWTKRIKEHLFLVFALGILLLAQSIDDVSTLKNRSVIQGFLKNAVVSQEQWGRFLIQESIPEIEKRTRSILSFLKESGSPDFAHSLWEKTLTARFNWYSSLDILDPEGNSLSRFSLNIPKMYGNELLLPPSRSWSIVRRTITSLGREKDFLFGYRDWFQDNHLLGRTILFLSLDPDTLPFLYSANPYFEFLRAAPIPSLDAVDFGLAVFDPEGRLLFNPQNSSSGIPPEVLKRLNTDGDCLWDRFRDNIKTYDSYYFRQDRRIYAFVTPRKSFRTFAVAFLKLFFIDLVGVLILILPAVFFFGRGLLKKVFWSFSNRVYAAFFAVSLIPLLLFTVFTKNLFDRIFAQRFVEEAASRAAFARSIMEDFIHFQQGESPGLLSPPEDLVLWVGATLSNDINLYKDARLLSSSRREFFDAGLLPELIDGQIYYDLLYKRAPFSAQIKWIGDSSFHTLTIPFDFHGSVFLISLPFPFEKQEVARATRELVEFLLLLSIFFAGLITLFSRGIKAMIVVPVRKLLAGTREVSLGNLEIRIEHPARDEMKTLVEGFNTMVRSLKEHEQDLAEMSKKVAWAEMARKVAHEIKNPLTPIQLSAEHIIKVFEDRRGDFEPTLRESISYIISEVENLRRISQEFMEIARDTTLRKEACDLRDLLKEVLAPYRKLLTPRIQFAVIFEGDHFPYQGDAAKLRTAFRNIITNAIEAVRDKGLIEISVSRPEGRFTIRFKDAGPGIGKSVLEKIFDPYFSTKDAGTGLGLPIARKIIEDHGGSIRAESEPGKGTVIIVDLPAEA